MKVAQFIELINNPADLTENHLPDLEKMVTDYPFFQSAHLLYAKALQNSQHINYHNALKKTAVIAGNRAVLYRLINQVAGSKYQVADVENPQTRVEKQAIKEEIAEKETIVETPAEKTKIVSSTNFSIPDNVIFEVIENKNQEQKAEKQALIENQETTKPETKKQETLDEIVLQPVVEAYIETEILRITEKEPEVNVDEPRSFTQWLQQVSESKYQAIIPDNKGTRIENQETIKPKIKTQKTNILDKILAEELRISKPQPDKNFFAASQKTRSSVLEDENLVTETLAKIYVLQGNQPKAIRAYEILSLKFPEKSAYFAALINDLKINLK